MSAIDRPAAAQSSIPRLITKRQLFGYANDGYLKHLTLSEAQLAEVHRLHEAYLANWSASFNQDIARFNAMWNAPFTEPAEFKGESMEGAFDEALEQADRLRFRLAAANDALFDQIELLLAESQAMRMSRVRQAHDRHIYRRSHGNGLYERHMDLVELVERMPLSDDDRARASAVIDEYEPVFVEALRKAAEAGQKRSLMQFRILDFARQVTPGEPVDPQIKAEMDHWRERAGKAGYIPERRLIEANR